MVVPIGWEFFYGYQSSLCSARDCTFKFFLETRIHEYVEFFLFLFFSSNAISQIFTCIVTYVECRNDKLSFVERNKGRIYFICFIFSTILTPPDVVNQIVWGVFLIILFECVVIRITLTEVFTTYSENYRLTRSS